MSESDDHDNLDQEAMSRGDCRTRHITGLFAPWRWGYQKPWLRVDIIAGITLAAYAIPVSLAYASLAGLPPHYGIYCYLLGGLAYVLLGTSRQLAIGPTSAIAMLVGTTVAGMSNGDPARWTAIASLTALLVTLICVVAWTFRLSSLMNFVSESILLGFKAGAALSIALTQFPKLFGVPGGGDHFVERSWILIQQLPETNIAVLSFGLVGIALLIVGEKLLPGRPVALAVVVLSIVVMSLSQLAGHGITVVGELPQGLPELSLPAVRARDVQGIVPLALACFMLSYIESISAARTLALRHGYNVDARQELLALGAANLAAGLAHGFPVAGGLSQSAVNDKAGARSPLSLVFASLTLGVCLVFLTGLLRNLPNVILAAVVLVAVKGLIDIPALRYLRRVSRLEFNVAMVALFSVLALGILQGVLLAAIASLVLLIASTAHPRVAVLGRIPGTERWSDIERHPENEVLPGLLVFRVEASLLYFNCEHVRQVIWERVVATPVLHVVVCDLSNSPRIDTAGAGMLAELQASLHKRGVQLRLAEAHAQVRDLIRATGLETQVGRVKRRHTLEQVIAEYQGASESATRMEDRTAGPTNEGS